MPNLHFLVWLRYLETEWNRPSRSDWYSMQVAAEIRAVRNSFSKNPKGVSLNSLKLKFMRPDANGKVRKPLTEAEAKRVESSWFARLGIRPTGEPLGPVEKREPGAKPKGPGLASSQGPPQQQARSKHPVLKPSQLIDRRKKSKPPQASDKYDRPTGRTDEGGTP